MKVEDNEVGPEDMVAEKTDEETQSFHAADNPEVVTLCCFPKCNDQLLEKICSLKQENLEIKRIKLTFHPRCTVLVLPSESLSQQSFFSEGGEGGPS